jgi:hypothetical protein
MHVGICSWQSARKGMDREGGILGTFVCTQRPQATAVVVFGVTIGDRPVQGVGVG